ncbi:MAG: hypothetical protein KDD25_06745 [Bdellovibrionales bacterium]|nr:hypothetical protein [Bdellovibrionales bacterium]
MKQTVYAFSILVFVLIATWVIWEFFPVQSFLNSIFGPEHKKTHLFVSDSKKQCRDNSNCVFINTSCGECTYGDAVSRNFADLLRSETREFCSHYVGKQCDLETVYGMDPRCEDGTCVLFVNKAKQGWVHAN